jgi:hypothetical protein
MGRIAQSIEALDRVAALRSAFMSSTASFTGPLPDLAAMSRLQSGIDQARLEVARLNRPEGAPPLFLRHPMHGGLIWVQGEPADWEAQLQAVAEGRDDLALRQAVGGLN